MTAKATLGTLLRHLLEQLDGAVEEAYAAAGLDYRPRYTPVMRALHALGPAAIRAISYHAGITHSAVSQTVSQMTARGLVRLQTGDDARERIVALTKAGTMILPKLAQQWAATEAAARSLDADLPTPLTELVRQAIAALETRSFGARIATAAKDQP